MMVGKPSGLESLKGLAWNTRIRRNVRLVEGCGSKNAHRGLRIGFDGWKADAHQPEPGSTPGKSTAPQ